MRGLILRALISVLLVLGADINLVAGENRKAEPSITRDLNYGDHIRSARSRQTLDLYVVDTLKQRPVVIYVHDGGWAFGDKAEVHEKPSLFLAHDMAFISMNYRLRWDYTIYDQASDVASVVRWVSDNGDKYGLDATRVVLLGAEAGGHLVSLVGTDERYLKGVGLSFANLACVAAIDTLTYNLQQHLDDTASFLQARHLSLIFGSDADVLAAASPSTYVGSAEALPSFALIYSLEDKAAETQTRSFAKKLSEASAGVIIIPAKEKEGRSTDEMLGTPSEVSTLALMAFIKAQI